MGMRMPESVSVSVTRAIETSTRATRGKETKYTNTTSAMHSRLVARARSGSVFSMLIGWPIVPRALAEVINMCAHHRSTHRVSGCE